MTVVATVGADRLCKTIRAMNLLSKDQNPTFHARLPPFVNTGAAGQQRIR